MFKHPLFLHKIIKFIGVDFMKINTMDIKKVLEKMGKVNVMNLNTLTLTFKNKKYYISLDNENIVINEDKNIIYYYIFIDSEYKKTLQNFFKEVI